MNSKKILGRSLTALLAAAMLTSVTVGSVSAAEIFILPNVVQGIAVTQEEVLPDAKLPTQTIDFNEYKKDYQNVVLQVPVYLYHSDMDDTYSMGNPALVHTAYIMVNDYGEGIVKLQFQGMDYAGSYGHLKRASYFESREDMEKWETGVDKSTKKSVEIERMDNSDNIEQISFKLPSGDPLVYVTVVVDAMNNSEVTARLGFDFSNIKVLEGKELTKFYVDQFENNVNSSNYTAAYYNVFEKNLFLAKKYLDSSNISAEKIESLNKDLSYNYDNRKYYKQEDSLRSACNKYLAAKQGDFTETSFQNLQNIASNALANLEAGTATGNTILRLENQLNKAVEALEMQEGKEKYSTRLQNFIAEMDALKPDDYLPSSWNAYQTNYMRSARTYAESGNEIQCRDALENAQQNYDSFVIAKRIVLTEEGNYTVKVTPKLKQEDGIFVDTDIVNDYIDFSKDFKLEIYEGKPTLYLNLNSKNGFPYARISAGNVGGLGWDNNLVSQVTSKKVDFAEGYYDDAVQTCVSLKMPTQMELKDTYIKISIFDENGETIEWNGQKAVYTVYLDINYENATHTGELDVDKTQLREEIDLFINQIDPTYIDEQDLIDVMYNEMGYTLESATAMANALIEAENVYLNVNATRSEVDIAYNNIGSTFDSMQQYTDVYDTVYNQALEILSISTQRAQYTTESIQALSTAFDHAFSTINDAAAGGLERTDYEAESVALQTALDNLKKVGGEIPEVDKTALNKKIAEAKAITADGYTSDSYQALQDAIASAETVANNTAATAEEVSSQISALDSAINNLVKEIVLEDGIYSIPVSLWHATNNAASMGNAGLDQTATLVVKDGKGELHLNFHSMTFASLTGYLSQIDTLTDIEFNQYNYPINYTKHPATIISEYDVIDEYNGPDSTDENVKGKMYPKEVSIPITMYEEYTWVHIYVPIMGSLGSGDQIARVKLDYSKIEKVETPEVDKTALNEIISEAKAIAADGYTVDSYQVLLDAITTAEAVANNASATEEEVAAQIVALNSAISALIKVEQNQPGNNNNDHSTGNIEGPSSDDESNNSNINGSVMTGDNNTLPFMTALLALASALGIKIKKEKEIDNH